MNESAVYYATYEKKSISKLNLATIIFMIIIVVTFFVFDRVRYCCQRRKLSTHYAVVITLTKQLYLNEAIRLKREVQKQNY